MELLASISLFSLSWSHFSFLIATNTQIHTWNNDWSFREYHQLSKWPHIKDLLILLPLYWLFLCSSWTNWTSKSATGSNTFASHSHRSCSAHTIWQSRDSLTASLVKLGMGRLALVTAQARWYLAAGDTHGLTMPQGTVSHHLRCS